LASAINPLGLTWTGPQEMAGAALTLFGKPSVQVSAPVASVSGFYRYGTAAFGQPATSRSSFGQVARITAGNSGYAAFTHTTGHAHWEVLLRARAIENQSYVLAAAQGGLHDNGRRTWGHTMVVDPWGEVLDLCEEGEGLVITEVDAARLAQVRQQLPALAHRRLGADSAQPIAPA